MKILTASMTLTLGLLAVHRRPDNPAETSDVTRGYSPLRLCFLPFDHGLVASNLLSLEAEDKVRRQWQMMLPGHFGFTYFGRPRRAESRHRGH